MKLKSLAYILMIGFISLLAGCDDEDSAFSGSENYITSFSLKLQDGKTYAATITEDELTLSVPEGVSVQGAKAEVLCSELATITPDPSNITDWEGNQTLTVTSYNGKERTYHYSLSRTLIVGEGDVLLETAEDVEAFAARGISRIEGNLIIGKETGSVKEDSLLSFAALSGVKEVSGTVLINPTYKGTSVAGLENLERAGALKIAGRIGTNGAFGNKELEHIELSQLKMVGGDLYLSADTLRTLNLPKLESVGGTLTLQAIHFKQLEFPALEIIGKDITFTGRQNGTLELTEEVSFPALKTLGNQLTLKSYKKVKKINFPALVSAATISLESLSDLEDVFFSSLEEISYSFSLQYPMNNLNEVSLPKLTKANSMRIYNNGVKKLDLGSLAYVGKNGLTIEHCQSLGELNLSSLTTVDGAATISYLAIPDMEPLKKLKSVGGDLKLTTLSNVKQLDNACPELETVGGGFSLGGYSEEATVLSGFNALKTIGGTFSLSSMPGVTDITGLGSLTSVSRVSMEQLPKLEKISFLKNLKGAHFSYLSLGNVAALKEMDVTGLTIDELKLSSVPEGLLLKGDDTFTGKVSVSGSKGMRFEGLENAEISLEFAIVKEEANFTFPGLKKAKKLTVTQGYNANLAMISFEDLEEVTGAMSLQEGSYVNNVVQPVQFPKLAKVGSFTYGGVLKTLSLPALQEVTGVCSIGTCFTNGVPAMLESINLPALKRVGTLKLTIGGATGSNPNTVITNLDCFENLESAESVYIEKQMGLISYKGLAKVIAGLNDAEAWEVIGNAFNPTFEEVKAGKLEKEE